MIKSMLFLLFLYLTAFSTSTEVNQREIDFWNYNIPDYLDFSVGGLSSLMGSLYYISGLNSVYIDSASEKKLSITAEKYVSQVNDETYKNFVKDRVCFGLASWCDETNKKKLYELCAKKIGDFTCQMNYLLKDLQQSKYQYNLYPYFKIKREIEEIIDYILTRYLIDDNKNNLNEEDDVTELREKMIEKSKYYYNIFSSNKYDTEITKNLYQFNYKYYTHLRYDTSELTIQDKDFEESGLELLAKIKFSEFKKLSLSNTKKITSFSSLQHTEFSETLKEFKINNVEFGSLSQLRYLNFPNLEILYLSNNNLVDLDGIKELKFPQLKKLTITWNPIENIDELKSSTLSLDNLEVLNLDHNNLLSDLSALKDAYLPKLKHLEIERGIIKDLDWLVDFKSETLEELILGTNQIVDISGIAKAYIPNVKEINLQENEIKNIEIISEVSFPELIEITFYHNQIKRIKGINPYSMPKLEVLVLSDNELSNLDELQGKTFENLKELYVIENNLASFDFFIGTNMPVLYRANFDENSITSLKGLKKANLSRLEYLDIRENSLRNLDDLDGVSLAKLKYLTFMTNEITDITGLMKANLPNLKEVDLRENKINWKNSQNEKTIDYLEKNGVEVSYYKN